MVLHGRPAYHGCTTEFPALAAMSSVPPLSSLPSGLQPPAAGWGGAEVAARAGGPGATAADAAKVFGFDGGADAARVLTVPAARGDSAAQLEARFLACLFTRG